MKQQGGSIIMIEKKISDIMTALRPDQTIDPDDIVREAIEKLEINHTGCVCVIDEEGRLEGIFTDGDVRRLFNRNVNETLAHIYSHPLSAVANKSPKAITTQHSLWEALVTMNELRIGALPIVDDDNKVQGVINMQELLKILLESAQLNESGIKVK